MKALVASLSMVALAVTSPAPPLPNNREITLLDQQLGRLRTRLRDMDLVENTILWYGSDIPHHS